MANWVEPEWLPTVPRNDRGPFYCYIFWVRDTRQYYVGHTGNRGKRINKHLDGNVATTAGRQLKLLWESGALKTRTNAKDFEAALKYYIVQRDRFNFRRCTGLYLAKGATLLEPRLRNRRW